MDSTFVCTYCGRLRPRSERVTVGADALCWSCSEEHKSLQGRLQRPVRPLRRADVPPAGVPAQRPHTLCGVLGTSQSRLKPPEHVLCSGGFLLSGGISCFKTTSI